MKWKLLPIGELGDLEQPWDTINSEGSNLPILDARFFRLLLPESNSPSTILAVCQDASGPVAATILMRKKFAGWQTFQPSQAPLGAWVQRPSIPLPDLLETLSEALGSPQAILSVTQLDPEIVDKPADDKRLRSLEHIETARLTLKDTFEGYWQRRGKNLKNNVKRQRNRLAREGIATLMESIDDEVEVGRAVDEYGLLESSGWKKDAGTAVHPANAQGQFYRTLLETYCHRGEGLVLRYRYDEKLVACDLCVHRDRTLVLLKTTFDEQQKTTSPSYLLRHESLQEFFTNRTFDRIEFYGRVMDWHRKWTDEFRQLYHVNYFRWRLAAALFDARVRHAAR